MVMKHTNDEKWDIQNHTRVKMSPQEQINACAMEYIARRALRRRIEALSVADLEIVDAAVKVLSS